MERNVFESDKRAVVYLDLLGYAALAEANPQVFITEQTDRIRRVGPEIWQPNVFYSFIKSLS